MYGNDHYTILAERDAHHHVAYCKHDVVHLTWGTVTLRFRPQDFARIINLLEQGAMGAGDRKICDGPICLIQNASGNFALIVKNFGLNLEAGDFLMLVDLVRVALLQIKHVRQNGSHSSSPSFQMSMPKYAGKPFSLN